MTDKESSSPVSPQDQPKNKTFIQQFVDFLQTFGVIGLAIGFIIGVASTDLVNSLVEDIINPLIGLILPSGSLETLSVNVTSISGVESEFRYGNLISNLLNFLIIAFVVFIAYKVLSKYKIVEDKTKSEPKDK